MDRKELGKRLKAVRAHLGITQAAMAAQLGVTLYTLREMEDGKACITVENINTLSSMGFNKNYFLEHNAAMIS
jgi:DNA-binding XRE family transcriptional regulator